MAENESNNTELENIENEIKRTEDLTRLFIQQEKERQKISIDFSNDKVSYIDTLKKEIIGGIGALITILFALTQIIDLTGNVVPWIIFLVLFALFLYIVFNRWRINTGNTLGELIASYDIGINKLEQVLEFIIVGTIHAYKGEKLAALVTADVILIMRDAIKLYQ